MRSLPASIGARVAVPTVLTTLTLSGCGGDAFLPPGASLAIGTWGGDNVGVIVSESGAHVHIGCTFGDVPGEIPLDADARFTIDGSYVLRAYPVQSGPALPARFSGRVVGRTLTFAVAVDDTVEQRLVSLGPEVVVFEREPEMGPCPICRVPPQASIAAGLMEALVGRAQGSR